MSLKKSKGNMYDWVSHTHSHLIGKCPHECGYCYVQAMAKRFPEMHKRYSGDIITVDESEFSVNYGKDNLIFIEHMNDLFADDVPSEIIMRILSHCRKYSDSKYVLQTKNPARYWDFKKYIPHSTTCGTTIESNRWHTVMGKSPTPVDRALGISRMRVSGFKTFITIEPILDFDLNNFVNMIACVNPTFVNIGADSKGHGLNEPSYEKIMQLYDKICKLGIEVRKKINLERLKK